MNELTQDEKQFIVRALHVAPLSGNAKQVQEVLVMIQQITAKLLPPAVSENGQVEEEKVAA